MQKCASCGAPITGRDQSCLYCGAINDEFESAALRAEALIARGIEAVQEGRNADAVKALSQAISLDPEAVDAYFYLAAAWQELNRNDRAIEVMRDLERLRPGDATVQFNLGVLLAYYGDKVEAIVYLRRALERLAGGADPKLLPEQREEMRERAERELERLENL